MFGTIREILFVTLLIIVTVIILKMRRRSKGIKVLGLIVVLSFSLCLQLIPFENVFYTFPSLEAACEYVDTGELKTVCEGKESFLVYSINKSYRNVTQNAFKKTDNGLKLLISALDIKHILFSGCEIDTTGVLITIGIYKIRNTDDYYICLSTTNFDKLQISDKYSTVFTETEWVEDKPMYDYLGYIHDLELPYVFEINGTWYSTEMFP